MGDRFADDEPLPPGIERRADGSVFQTDEGRLAVLEMLCEVELAVKSALDGAPPEVAIHVSGVSLFVHSNSSGAQSAFIAKRRKKTGDAP